MYDIEKIAQQLQDGINQFLPQNLHMQVYPISAKYKQQTAQEFMQNKAVLTATLVFEGADQTPARNINAYVAPARFSVTVPAAYQGDVYTALSTFVNAYNQIAFTVETYKVTPGYGLPDIASREIRSSVGDSIALSFAALFTITETVVMSSDVVLQMSQDGTTYEDVPLVSTTFVGTAQLMSTPKENEFAATSSTQSKTVTFSLVLIYADNPIVRYIAQSAVDKNSGTTVFFKYSDGAVSVTEKCVVSNTEVSVVPGQISTMKIGLTYEVN